MNTFFRIDEWNRTGNSSTISFEETEAGAMSFTKSMSEISLGETEGAPHTSIQKFKADTCNMDGWNAQVGEYSPIHYA